METYKLGEMEGRLAELIWDHAPLEHPGIGGTLRRHFRLETHHHLHHAEAAMPAGNLFR